MNAIRARSSALARVALIAAATATTTIIAPSLAGCRVLGFYAPGVPCDNDTHCVAPEVCGPDGVCAGSTGVGEGEGEALGCVDEDTSFASRLRVRAVGASCDPANAISGLRLLGDLSCLTPETCTLENADRPVPGSTTARARFFDGSQNEAVALTLAGSETESRRFAIEVVAETTLASGGEVNILVIPQEPQLVLTHETLLVGSPVVVNFAIHNHPGWHHIMCFVDTGDADDATCFVQGRRSSTIFADDLPDFGALTTVDVARPPYAGAIAAVRVWSIDDERIDFGDGARAIALRRMFAAAGLDVQAGPPGSDDERRAAGARAWIVDQESLAPRAIEIGADAERAFAFVDPGWPRVIASSGTPELLVEASCINSVDERIDRWGPALPTDCAQGELLASVAAGPPFEEPLAVRSCVVQGVHTHVLFSPAPDSTFSVFAAPTGGVPGEAVTLALEQPCRFAFDDGSVDPPECGVIEAFRPGWVRLVATGLEAGAEATIDVEGDVRLWWPQVEAGAVASSPTSVQRDGDTIRLAAAAQGDGAVLHMTGRAAPSFGQLVEILGSLLLEASDDALHVEGAVSVPLEPRGRFTALVGLDGVLPVCPDGGPPCAALALDVAPFESELGLGAAFAFSDVLGPEHFELVQLTEP